MLFKKRHTILTDEKSNHSYRLIIACLVFVLTLVITGTLAINHFIQSFRTDISQNYVFEVDLQGVDADQHQHQIMAIQQTINAVPGVKESMVTPLESGEPSSRIIFIEARVNPHVPFPADDIFLKLRQISPHVHLQSHKFVQHNLVFLERSLQIFSYSMIILIGLTIVVAISLITRSSLDIHKGVIDILRLIGAPNSYITTHFQWTAFKIGISASGVGVALGILLCYGMLQFGLSFGLSQAFIPFDSPTLLLFILMPFFLGFLSLIVARLEVFRTLVKLDG